MDIGKGNSYPSNSLSNFSPHPFEIDGVFCNSMEGFLQSLKFSNVEMQRYVCTLVGIKAKRKGAKKNWKQKQLLYWQGKSYKRDSKEYQELLDRAFEMLGTNKSFQKALLATKDSTLEHSIGKNKITDTVLTKQEFCSRLYKLREKLKKEFL